MKETMPDIEWCAFLTSEDLLDKKSRRAMVSQARMKAIFAAFIFVGVLSVIGLITLIVLWYKKLTPFQDFAIVVDAGSTHSKIFLYQWPSDKSDGLGTTSRVTQRTSCKVAGDAITSVTDPTEDNVRQYFESGMSQCINEIPANRKSRAMIFLGGTAGLRLFEMKNSSYTNNLLNSTRAYFSSLGLHFQAPEDQVRIISGSEEGLSGWITTNILMDQLFKVNDPEQTYGVSDMGGASTQISFNAPNAAYDRYAMSLFDTDYDVYSHSYLCYGTEQFRLTYLAHIVNKANGTEPINDPCLQNGFILNSTYDDIFSTPCARDQYVPLPILNISSEYTIIGTGNSVECSIAVQERIDTSICNYSTCSFDNVYQPKPISPSLKFIAMSAWFSVFNTLAPNVSLAPNSKGNYDFATINLAQIKSAIAAICNQSWPDVIKPDVYRPALCFNSMYHWTLLERGYSMTDDNLKNFQIVKTIDGNEIGWTLGYMINQTNALQADKLPGRLLTRNEFGGLIFLCVFFLLLSIIVSILTRSNFTGRESFE